MEIKEYFSDPYSSLNSKIKENQIRIINIDSPARCCGTALMRVLNESQDIFTYLYEPFRRVKNIDTIINSEISENLSLKKARILKNKYLKELLSNKNPQEFLEKARLIRSLYSYIEEMELDKFQLNELKQLQSSSRIIEGYQKINHLVTYKKIINNNSKQPKTILTKQLSKNICFNEDINKWNSLLDKKIFLIRNPLLQIESLIKAMIKELKSRKEMSEFDFENYAKKMNELFELKINFKKEAWEEFTHHLIKKRNYVPFNDVILTYLNKTIKSDYSNEQLKDIVINFDDNLAKELGYKNLNEFAKKKGHNYGKFSWKIMLLTEINKGDLSKFQELFDKWFYFRRSGWRNILYNFNKSENPIVVDSTLYRAFPEKIIPKLCDDLKIGYSENMINHWKNKFQAGHGEKTTHYNNKSGNSSAIMFPKEKCLKLENFPKIYQEHIIEIAMKNYLEILKQRTDFTKKKDVLGIVNLEIDNLNFAQIDPVFVYSLITTSSMNKAEQQKLLDDVIKKCPDFKNVFKIITKWSKEK